MSFLPLKGEVHLTNDIGRDFLLLQELDQKKIVLIGPRSNTQGVFHGPLWTYMNYPAYLLGNGNPVIVAWFWVMLGFIFLLSTFFILKKIFGTIEAVLGVALLSVYLVPHINSVFSPEAMFFFMPFFLFTIYRYVQTKRIKFLAFHILTLGIFLHLNIGVGILFLMLSIPLILILILKNRLWKHLITFIILPLTTINFIAFDLKHGFRMAKALLNLGGSSGFIIPVNEWIANRIDNIISMQILANNIQFVTTITFILICVSTLFYVRKKYPQKDFVLILAFYYFGYMLLSYFNKGIILYHYIYIMVPLTSIWLVSFLKGSVKYLFIPLIVIVLFLNFKFSLDYINEMKNNFMGKSLNSWISLQQVGKFIAVQQDGKEFGYFVYSPDAFAYQQRYAMIYSFKSMNAHALEYQKKDTTYVFASPPPPDNPYMGHQWWIENEANIKAKPVSIKIFSSRYIVEKFNLTEKEQKVPFDPNIVLGLSFR